jgi:hypothetical protein
MILSGFCAILIMDLRRGRDSNPRYPFEVYTLSRRALSTTQTPLRLYNLLFFQIIISLY